MKTKEEMDASIREYCYKLIMKTEHDAWEPSMGKYKIVDGNVEIIFNRYCFSAHINGDRVCSFFHLPLLIRLFTLKKRNKYLIHKKINSLKSYLDDKEAYNRTLQNYNALPIKVSRKNKLEQINE